MIRSLRTAAKRVLHAWTRGLHTWRRAKARRRLAGGGGTRSVLFLCLGNVCRSPYAEASLRRIAPDVTVASAGFIGPGRNAPEEAQDVALRRGVDLSNHVSRVVTQTMANRYDLIVVMDPSQRAALGRRIGRMPPVVALGDLDPLRPDTRRIPDPWGQGVDVYEASFARIDRCLLELLPALSPELLGPAAEGGRV